MVKESTFWAAELNLSLVITVRNLRPQFHLKSHGASFCVVCKTRMMRWENKNEIIEKNQKESNKKKIKVILKNTLLELGGSCGLVTVIRPLVSEKREMDQLTCLLYRIKGSATVSSPASSQPRMEGFLHGFLLGWGSPSKAWEYS